MSNSDSVLSVMAAIAKGNQKTSILSQRQLEVDGMTGIKVRHLLNNLAAISNNCFEVGCFKGAMTVAANYGNHVNYFICDNWSQYNNAETNKDDFYGNIESHGIKCTVFEQDCFTIDLSKLPKIDLYIFDGDHNVEAQTKALTYFKPVLAEQFILVVDDYSWPEAMEGTELGIKEAGMKVLFAKELGVGIEGDADGWWNGLLVALIENK